MIDNFIEWFKSIYLDVRAWQFIISMGILCLVLLAYIVYAIWEKIKNKKEE